MIIRILKIVTLFGVAFFSILSFSYEFNFLVNDLKDLKKLKQDGKEKT
jgi:hypothetical protein